MEKEILAFHEQNLEEVLQRLELFDDFRNRKLRCSVCNRILTKENFGCIYPEDNDIKVCCSNLKCLNEIRKKEL